MQEEIQGGYAKNKMVVTYGVVEGGHCVDGGEGWEGDLSQNGFLCFRG